MTNKFFKQAALAVTVLLASTGSVWADSAAFRPLIVKVTVSDPDTFGGCMAKTSIDPQTTLPTCKANWVTFSCNGQFNPKDVGHLKLDQAQLAMVLNKQTRIEITDTKKHNGYCFATRIDVFN